MSLKFIPRAISRTGGLLPFGEDVAANVVHEGRSVTFGGDCVWAPIITARQASVSHDTPSTSAQY